jgi:hypothetical protein
MLLSDCKKTDPAFHAFVTRLMTECRAVIQRHTIAFFDEEKSCPAAGLDQRAPYGRWPALHPNRRSLPRAAQ